LSDEEAGDGLPIHEEGAEVIGAWIDGSLDEWMGVSIIKFKTKTEDKGRKVTSGRGGIWGSSLRN
jgi:hypothetical protein